MVRCRVERSAGLFGLISAFEGNTLFRFGPFSLALFFRCFARGGKDADSEHKRAPLRDGGDEGRASNGHLYRRSEEISQSRINVGFCFERSMLVGVYRG